MGRDESVYPALTEVRDDDPFLNRFLPGPSAAMRKLRALVHHVNTEENSELIKFILLTGESGSGKYRVAQAVAGQPRWKKGGMREPVEPISEYAKRLGELLLTALSESTAESELFGHVRGAFTGAEYTKPGLFSDDDYDHLLLEEIGDAPLSIQGKLLSVLEGRPFTPVGASGKGRNQRCNKRILMATKQNLSELVRAGHFRDDLYNRVVRWKIHVPGLRECTESIPDIARSLIEERCPNTLKKRLGGLPRLEDEDLAWAKTQMWPGNIRELGDLIEDWLSRGGQDPLREVARGRENVGIDAREKHSGLRVEVRRAIEDILSGERPSPGTVGAFTSGFTRPLEEAVQAEVHAWYSETGASRDKCMKLFGDSEWSSIKSTMSSIKRRIGKAK